MIFPLKPMKLHDCLDHGLGSGSELFIVEGDSASKTVARARDSRTQAVLPMQGKPMNALKAKRKSVDQNELYSVLRDAIGAGWDETFDLSSMRYSRVIMLFDPDADGIHCGALMLMYFMRWMRPILDAGRLHLVQPPLYQITSPIDGDVIHAYSTDHFHEIRAVLESKKIEFQSQRFRGLASMSDQTLSKTCLDPETRQIHALTIRDAEAAVEAFAGRREIEKR